MKCLMPLTVIGWTAFMAGRLRQERLRHQLPRFGRYLVCRLATQKGPLTARQLPHTRDHPHCFILINSSELISSAFQVARLLSTMWEQERARANYQLTGPQAFAGEQTSGIRTCERT